MFTRRQTLSLAAGALIGPSAWAQTADPGMKRIGFIATSVPTYPGVAAFRDELAKLGYTIGQNLQLEERFAEGKLDRLPGFAAELAGLKLDLIAVIGAVTVRAVRGATGNIPIVFTVVLDPVADGLVADAERPGGRITGTTNYDPAQPRAQMRLLKEIKPDLKRVAIIGDAGVPELLDRANKAAAEEEGIVPVNIRLKGASEDMDGITARLRQEAPGALLLLEVPAASVHVGRLIAWAHEARVLTLAPGDAARWGATLAYGSSLIAAAGRMAILVDRVLKGAKPGDVPVEVITKHRFVANVRAARDIGLTLPPAVLARADQVIE
jgi:putative tryptophan/tyrosine transport system substrate-binding protein